MRSTMAASASGMIVAASIIQPTSWVVLASIRMMTNSPDGDVAHAFDAQVGAPGLVEIDCTP